MRSWAVFSGCKAALTAIEKPLSRSPALVSSRNPDGCVIPLAMMFKKTAMPFTFHVSLFTGFLSEARAKEEPPMTNAQLDGEPVWAQWRTRRRRSRAKLKALQLMTTRGVIRATHVELRPETTAHRISISSQEARPADNAVTHATASATGSDSRHTRRMPLIQRLRRVFEGMLHIQRRLLAELRWGPDKA